jgi:hypothetical protein
MSIREIIVTRFRFFHPGTIALQTGKAERQIEPLKQGEPSIRGIGRNTYSPFDVRYGNQVILQFRHDYVR